MFHFVITNNQLFKFSFPEVFAKFFHRFQRKRMFLDRGGDREGQNKMEMYIFNLVVFTFAYRSMFLDLKVRAGKC